MVKYLILDNNTENQITYNMTKFVYDNAKLVTIFTDRYCLGSISSFSNERAASTNQNTISQVNYTSNILEYYFEIRLIKIRPQPFYYSTLRIIYPQGRSVNTIQFG